MRSARHVFVFSFRGAAAFVERSIEYWSRPNKVPVPCVPYPSGTLDRHSETLNLRGELLILNRRCARVRVHVYAYPYMHTYEHIGGIEHKREEERGEERTRD